MRTRAQHITALSTALTTLVACDTSVPHSHPMLDSSLREQTSATPLHKENGDTPAQCLVPETKPALWLPLDAVNADGNTPELVETLDARIVSSDGTVSFNQGKVGNAVVLNGSTYVDVFDLDRIDPNRDGFAFGLWAKSVGKTRGTLFSHGLRFDPGSWRLLSTGQGGIQFEVCDPSQCQTVDLDGSFPTDTWTYVGGILTVLILDDGLSVDVSLNTFVGDEAYNVNKTIKLPADFSFNVPGPRSLGASLDDVPDEEEYPEPHVVTTPADTFVGLIDEMVFYGGPVSEGVLVETADAQSGLCEACINDVVPPEIQCPASFSIHEGDPIRPLTATASDDCDPNPTILNAVSSPNPGVKGETITVTYTAIDASGNQSSCTSEITIVAPPLPGPPADKAILTPGSCALMATPGSVTSGDLLSLGFTNTAGSCTNGSCRLEVDLSYGIPGAYAGYPSTALTHITTQYNQTNTVDYDGIRSHTWWSISYNLLQPISNSYNIAYRVYDQVSGEFLGQWSCSTYVTINPVVDEYCEQPISYWLQSQIDGTVTYFNLNDPNTFSGSGWFDGTDGEDLIIGRPGPDKINGNDDNDCIIGNAGADTIKGDWGHDYVEGGSGVDEIHGEQGNDEVHGGPGVDKIWGGDNDDWLYGGTGGDKMWGEEYPDHIHGEGGNDVIKGGGYEDFIYGEEHNDQIKGNEGTDEIYGGSGCDTLEGDPGYDYVNGGAGDDRMWGGDGFDTLSGGEHRDYIRGDDGVDELYGGNGDDFMCGIGSFNHHVGDGGNDECRQPSNNGWMICENDNGRLCNHNNWERPTLQNCD